MPHGETADDKMSLTGADHRARAPQNLCYQRAPLTACWEERCSDVSGVERSWVQSWLCRLFFIGCWPYANTAAFATSALMAQHATSHTNCDLKLLVSMDVSNSRGLRRSRRGFLKSKIQFSFWKAVVAMGVSVSPAQRAKM